MAQQHDGSPKDKSILTSILQVVVPVIGVIAVAFFGYQQATEPERIRIRATQTAEARLTTAAIAAPIVTSPTDTPEPTSTSTQTPTVAPAVVTIESRICVNNAVSNTIWLSDETFTPVQEKSEDAEGKLLSIISVDGNPLSVQGLVLKRWDKTLCHVGLTSQTVKQLKLVPDLDIQEQLERPIHTFEVFLNPSP